MRGCWTAIAKLIAIIIAVFLFTPCLIRFILKRIYSIFQRQSQSHNQYDSVSRKSGKKRRKKKRKRNKKKEHVILSPIDIDIDYEEVGTRHSKSKKKKKRKKDKHKYLSI